MHQFDTITVVIPSLDPDERILETIRGIKEKGFTDILLIDDGSAPENQHYFETAERELHCTVLHHDRNYGKGHALKTAFLWLLANRPASAGCVTVDGDGQHHKDDIAACTAQMLEEGESALYLGVRDFDTDNVPARSAFGNRCTAFVFRTFCGLRIKDTQTGLRVYPKSILPQMLEISGERFEYETNMLLMCKKLGIPIRQRTIQTIYLEENKASHFQPVRDSIRIYGVILKFFPASIPSYALDNLLFGQFNSALSKRGCKRHLFWSVLGARAISAAFHHKLSRGSASRSDRSTKTAAVRNTVIRVIQCLCSLGATAVLSKPFKDQVKAQGIIKAVTDIVFGASGYRLRQRLDIKFKKMRNS